MHDALQEEQIVILHRRLLAIVRGSSRPGRLTRKVDATKPAVDPRRYFVAVRTDSDVPPHEPVCLYLETTNRCNLLCTTCPRTL